MDLKDTKELAKELRMSEATLRNWRAQGKGPPHLKLEGAVLYEEEQVKAWKEKQRKG